MSTEPEKTAAIIVAAGASRRMNGRDKIFASLSGQPVLAHTIAALGGCGEVGEIILVVSRENMERCRQMVVEQGYTKVTHICAGGDRRQDSVRAGLEALDGCDWVIVHDGARPLVTGELIRRGLEAAKETGASAAAVPVTDTVKRAGEDNIVRQTLPREGLWAVQTPQVFRYDILSQAYQRATGDVTDDAALVEANGGRVKLYLGDYGNIKITNPQDLVLAEVLLKNHGR